MQGIPKSIDRNGRIVVPIETLRAAGLKRGDLVDISLDRDDDGDAVITIEKSSVVCCICGSEKPGEEFRGKKICRDCVGQLKEG